MSHDSPPAFGQFVTITPQNTAAFIDATNFAKEAGFYFSYTGISQHAYYQAIDVPDCAVSASTEALTRQL